MTLLESVPWYRILGFCFDHGGTAVLSFAVRLVTDNSWELLCALRILDEYRRFARFLVMMWP